MTNALKPASDAFLSEIIKVANAMRFMRFVASNTAEITPLSDAEGFIAETPQATITIERRDGFLIGSIEPGPTGPEFEPTSFTISGEDFAHGAFMTSSITPINGKPPQALLDLAGAYAPIDQGGRIMAHEHAGQEFGTMAETNDPESLKIDGYIDNLARGLDAVSAVNNLSFMIHLKSPALTEPGSIDAANMDGRIFPVPASDDANAGRRMIGERIRLLRHFADQRPDAIMIQPDDSGHAQWRIRPLAFTYSLPMQASEARQHADTAYAALVQLRDAT